MCVTIKLCCTIIGYNFAAVAYDSSGTTSTFSHWTIRREGDLDSRPDQLSVKCLCHAFL